MIKLRQNKNKIRTNTKTYQTQNKINTDKT